MQVVLEMTADKSFLGKGGVPRRSAIAQLQFPNNSKAAF